MRPRPYSGHEELVAMEAAASAAWAAESPFVAATAGDLHWWMYQHTDRLDEIRIALWEEGSELAGWSW